MGATGTIVGGILGGLLLGTMSGKGGMSGGGFDYSSLLQQNNAAALESLPTAPTDPDSGENDEAEAERQRQLAILEANNGMANPTGGRGLGNTGSINTQSKKVLG